MIESSLAWGLVLAFLGAYAAIHAACTRIWRMPTKIGFHYMLFAVFLPAVIVSAWLGFEAFERSGTRNAIEPIWGEAGALALLGVFYVLFAAFYTALDHSVRIRVCIELHAAGAMPLGRLLERYDVRAANERRLAKLVNGGFLRREGDRYALTPKGRRVGDWVNRVRRLYGAP